MTTDEEIVAAVKKQKYRSANKVLPYIKRKFPDVSEKRIMNLLRHRILHDASVRRINENSIYFNKVFSQTTNGWFFDIFVNPKGKPPYYLMFINQNTK